MQAQPWELKDTLRQMTQKFNDAVAAINELQDSSTTVNAATTERLTQLETQFNTSIQELSNELETKVSEVSAVDLGLDKVDNTSDMDKPVSTAQQAAIDAAVEDMVTSEEIGDELNTLNLYDPEVSYPVKQYIENRMAELFNGLGTTYTPEYNIASDSQLGVVKSGGDATINQTTGQIEIPKLAQIVTIKSSLQALTQSLESNNAATSQLVTYTGDLTNLQTTNKTSLVDAINELYQMIRELDA